MSSRNKILLVCPMLHPEGERILDSEAEVVRAPNYHTDQLKTMVSDVDAIIARGPALVSGEVIRAAKKLQILSAMGAGADCIDAKVATELGIPVIHAPGVAPTPVAEHTVGLMIAVAKHIVEADAFLRAGGEWEERLARFTGCELQGKTLGIIGLGNIGREVARKCRAAFDMRVIAYDAFVRPEQAALLGIELVDHLDDLLQRADVVSTHCALTDQTRGLIGARELALMKPTAYLINTSRGPVVDQKALEGCLKAKGIAGAGIDVHDPEPSPKDNPLFSLPNVVVTPHIAGASEDGFRRLATLIANDVLGALDGQRPSHLLNPEVWPAYEKRVKDGIGAL